MSSVDPPFVKMLICPKADSAKQTPRPAPVFLRWTSDLLVDMVRHMLWVQPMCHQVQTHQSTCTQLQADCSHDELYQWASVTCQIREMCCFVSDTRERQLDCLQAVISGARRASMFLAEHDRPAVPERTKQSRKRFIIVYVWLNNGSTTPAAQALVHRRPAGGGRHADDMLLWQQRVR